LQVNYILVDALTPTFAVLLVLVLAGSLYAWSVHQRRKNRGFFGWNSAPGPGPWTTLVVTDIEVIDLGGYELYGSATPVHERQVEAKQM